jgi:hypothetical protein
LSLGLVVLPYRATRDRVALVVAALVVVALVVAVPRVLHVVWGGVGGGVVWCWLCFEICIVGVSIFVCCVQVFEGTRWMPWYQEPMKDVGACVMPRGVGNRALIRGFPNGVT